MKNHTFVDGKLLQTNKKFSHLKLKQQQQIMDWLTLATREATLLAIPVKKRKQYILDSMENQIQRAGIHLPYGELMQFYTRKKAKIDRKSIKNFTE